MSSEPNKPDDRELEDFLQGSSRIGAAYREAARQDSAPRELDAAILAMARAAVATPVRRRPRWIQPMAVAATLALSLGVLLNIWRDPSARQQLAPMAESGVDAAVDAAAPASMSVESEAGMAAPVAEQKSAVPALADADARPEATQPELRKKQEPAAKISSEPVQAEVMTSAPRPAPAPLAPPPPPPAAMDESAAPVGALSAKPEPAEPLRAEPPAAAPGMNSTDAPTAAAGAMAPAKSREALRLDALSERDRAAKRSSAPSAASAAERMARENEAAEDRVEDITPEQWIEGIRARIAQGDTVGARAALKDFREAYPGYALPADLKPYDVAPPR